MRITIVSPSDITYKRNSLLYGSRLNYIYQPCLRSANWHERYSFLFKCIDEAPAGARFFFPFLDPFLLHIPLIWFCIVLSKRQFINCSGILFDSSFFYPFDGVSVPLHYIKSLLKASLILISFALRIYRVPLLCLDLKANLFPFLFRWLPDCLSHPFTSTNTSRNSSKSRASSSKITLIFAGFITPRKGLLELLEILNSFTPFALSKFRFLIMGKIANTNYQVSCEALIQKLLDKGIDIEHSFSCYSQKYLLEALLDTSAILLPYRYHYGSSAFVYMSHHHGIPLLSPRHFALGFLSKSFLRAFCFNPLSYNSLYLQMKLLISAVSFPSKFHRKDTCIFTPDYAQEIYFDLISSFLSSYKAND